jgi:hypothetical protein
MGEISVKGIGQPIFYVSYYGIKGPSTLEFIILLNSLIQPLKNKISQQMLKAYFKN